MESRIFQFNKNTQGEWFLLLPEWMGDPTDLQMVEGADEWLDLVSGHALNVKIQMADCLFEGANMLTLIRTRDDNLGGGGIYFLESYNQRQVDLKLWLCDVTEFVFGTIPQKIYFKKC